MLTSTITQKGQITIPKKIRTALDLQTNDKIVFVRRGGQIIIKPLRDIFTLRGSVKVSGEQDFSDIRKKTQRDITKRIANE